MRQARQPVHSVRVDTVPPRRGVDIHTEVWPLARVQTAYATTLKVLYELQGIIDEVLNSVADDDPFWRRRQIEVQLS